MGRGKVRSASERAAAGSAVYDKTIINQIMLKYRPIAPKPLGDGEAADPKKAVVGKKRVKRKYVRMNKRKVVCDNKEDDDKADKSVVTLQLLPVTDKISPTSVDSGRRDLNIPDLNVGVGRRVVESWVTLECVTDGYDNEGWLGWTDGEKVRNLEMDTCPGFLFDGFDEVVKWVNLSYKMMVAEEEDDDDVVVRVAVKGRFPREMAAFSCRARLSRYRRKLQQQGNGVRIEEKQTVSVPCDVWRMDYGGLFACRLDVKAALSLGR